ncbi:MULTISPECIES: DUF6752 domain-containing protein [unclassified Blastococcus]
MSPQSQSRPTRGGAVWAVRRALAPAALELPEQLARLTDDNARLREQADDLRSRLDAAEERLAEFERQVAELRDGLHESRRLNLRVAELTDLVTELVLPLHDREIDPAVLARLRPDTL